MQNFVGQGGYGRLGFAVGTAVLCLCAGVAIRYAAAAVAVPGRDALYPLFDALCHWDCPWYLYIAENGYEEFPTTTANNVGNWGFFPLYPFLVGVVRLVLPLTTLQVATLTSLALTFTACLVAWPLLNGHRRSYALYATYVLAGPFSYHFATSLTESLFLLMTSLAMLALQRRNYFAAGAASALLSATRIVGVFMVFATVVTMLQQYRASGGRLLGFPLYVLKQPHLVLAILISPLGLFAYMLWLSMVVGDGFAFSNVQRAFGRHIDWPWLHWWDAAKYTPEAGWWPTASQWSAGVVIVGLALTAVLAVRKQYGLALFCVICILLPISSGLASIVRYTAALAPLALTLASLLAATRATTVVMICVFLALCYILTGEWIGGHLALV